MDANAIVTSVQQLAPLELLEKVDLFYKGAWDKLVLYVTILIAFTGVLIPIILTWLQRKLFALEEDKIKIELKKYCDELKKEIKQDITLEFKEQKNIIDRKFVDIEIKLKKRIAESRGATFHIQGNTLLQRKSFPVALESYLDAIDLLIEANDHLNLNRVLQVLIAKCMPEIYAEDLENIERDGFNLDETIKLLEDNDLDSKYADQIRDFKKAIHLAKQKKRSPNATGK